MLGLCSRKFIFLIFFKISIPIHPQKRDLISYTYMHLVLTIHANKIEAITQGDMLLSFLPLKKYDAYINIIVEFSQGKR